MKFYNENSSNKILELLNCPIIDRCPELTLLFDRCSLRELQEIFPSLVNSIFGGINPGGLGWGLRTITRENSPQNYDILYQFFTPLGPMFRLCYRLLNDAIKFDLNIDLLPKKLKDVVLSTQYSVFYSDLIAFDTYHRTGGSLSLNAFDYFLLNFAIHGTIPLHQMNPVALQVHNERSKTAYFFLTAEYLCSFLPSNPDVVVLPTNICSTVKAPQPMPVPPLQQSTQSFNYMETSLLLHFPNATQSVGVQESPRIYAWRTESVLNLFVDVWFQFDFNETRDLPSSEFVRCVRILVKQLHAFSNSADFDNTPMAVLRRQAQPMMRLRIFPFLRGIIARWPLDSSMGVVLELWLSYIQPWRYTFEREIGDNSQRSLDLPNSNKFETFICENLPIYTQIFIQILPRFERLDFTSYRNASMLLRIVKVFGQRNLANLLIHFEQRRPNTFPSMTPNINSRSPSFYSPPRSGQASDWNLFRFESAYHDETYIQMFGDSIREQVHRFLNIVCIAKMNVLQEIEAISTENIKQNRALSYIKRLFFSLLEDMSPAQMKLNEISRIPNILDFCIQFFAETFQVEVPQVLMEQDVPYSEFDFSSQHESGRPDLSKISPLQMKNALKTMKPTIDPALYPIQDMELAWLVRMLHEISCKINDRYSYQIQNLWGRNDIFGKIAKQILYPPMTMRWFQKVNGHNEMMEEDLPARICLRTLASFKTLGVIFVIFLLGKFLLSSASFGLLLFIVAICFYIFVKALIM